MMAGTSTSDSNNPRKWSRGALIPNWRISEITLVAPVELGQIGGSQIQFSDLDFQYLIELQSDQRRHKLA